MDTLININTNLDKNILEVDVKLNISESYEASDIMYMYRLKKDGKIVQKTDKITENKYSFLLLEFGQYWIQICCLYKNKEYWKNSRFVFYIESFIDEYSIFCEKEIQKEIPPLKYFEPQYPFQDFCIIWGKDINKNMNKQIKHFSDLQKLNPYTYKFLDHMECTLLTTRSICNLNGIDFAFSGITRDKNKLIVGDKDIIKNNVDIQSLNDEIGDYFLIFKDDDGIHITHDYLGLSKVFYYQDKNCFIASNRYHMLLLALKSCNIYPEVNIKRAIADLSSVSAFARLNYSRHMIMENTYMMLVDQSIMLTGEQVIFKNTSLHDELFNPESYSEEKYHNQLHIAKDELLDNMQIALEYPDYNKYKVDLSGGMDTRLVFAVLSNMLEFHNTIQINTQDLPNYPLDLYIALELNSLYNFKYDEIPSIEVPVKLNESFNNIVSGALCTNQQQKPSRSYIFDENIMKLPGFLGELVCRPHMYTKFKGTVEEDNISIDEFIDNREYYHMEAISKEGLNYYKNLLKEELKYMPGKTPMQKLQNHYLFYMETIHHSTYFNSSLSQTLIWTPLVSKTLFHLNNITGIIFRSNKLAHDIMHILNPVIAAIPYEKILYNDEKQELSKMDSKYKSNITIPDSIVKIQKEKWELAQEQKKKNRVTIECLEEDRFTINEENKIFPDSLRDNTLLALRKIIHFDDGSIGNIVGLECFSRIFGRFDIPREKRYIDFLYTKILTLYHVLKIFDYID